MRFFVCLGVCRLGFLDGCRPFIGLDGCHLKGFYKDIMLSATYVDADNCLFPLAFAVVESETGDSWIWFLEMLHEAIGDVDGLALMSDKDKGLESAVPGMKGAKELKDQYLKKKQPIKKRELYQETDEAGPVGCLIDGF
ncbi:hypothetical protein QJS10_CPA10g01278 [Acorus calamus]|uniref:MULE transposase domain-containing protein n=1 Tax=Acorus calamus TaxID=4465 RepID=A0AAV9DX05_ACOCL|nr:hypothetical protein QJS10_CPA10g01278 [Acorus calamus]